MKNRIAITLSSFAEIDPAPLELLRKSGLETANNVLGRRLNKKETLELCKGCVGIIAGLEKYDSDLLEKLSGVKVISRCGIGVDNIDLNAAKRLGIAVKNTPDGPTQAVAELAIGLMLDTSRSISFMDRSLRAGRWNKTYGSLISGKTVGIIGLGRIGRRVAELLGGFNVSIIAHDTSPAASGNKPGKVKMAGLKYLLRHSDIITLHPSGNTRVMDKEAIGMMKKGSYIINLSRGGTLDEKALYQALKTGRIAGAALDVFSKEPYDGPLAKLENVILTPHAGSYAKEARAEMELQAAQNLLDALGALKRRMI